MTMFEWDITRAISDALGEKEVFDTDGKIQEEILKAIMAIPVIATIQEMMDKQEDQTLINYCSE